MYTSDWLKADYNIYGDNDEIKNMRKLKHEFIPFLPNSVVL